LRYEEILDKGILGREMFYCWCVLMPLIDFSNESLFFHRESPSQLEVQQYSLKITSVVYFGKIKGILASNNALPKFMSSSYYN